MYPTTSLLLMLCFLTFRDIQCDKERKQRFEEDTQKECSEETLMTDIANGDRKTHQEKLNAMEMFVTKKLLEKLDIRNAHNELQMQNMRRRRRRR